MKFQKFLLTAALGLVMSALTAQAAPNIPISGVPFNISGPGTYVLVRNLTYTGSGSAITISNITGPVILDFKGFTLTGPGTVNLVGIGTGITVQGNGLNTITNIPVTIRNGTVSQFLVGLFAFELNNLTITSMAFPLTYPGSSSATGIHFILVSDSLINDCDISSALYGIIDDLSREGNRYVSVFCGADNTLEVPHYAEGLTVKYCEFEDPTIEHPTNEDLIK